MDRFRGRRSAAIRRARHRDGGAHPWRAMMHTRPAIIVLLLAVIWMAVAAGREWVRRHDVEREIAAIEQEISRVEAVTRQAQENLSAADRSDVIEREARRRLNFSRAGEVVVVVAPEALQEAKREETSASQPVFPSAVAVSVAPGPKENILAWWNYFFGGR